MCSNDAHNPNDHHVANDSRHDCADVIQRLGRPHRRGVGDPAVKDFIIDLANENPTWGYPRIRAELILHGHDLAPPTVWKVLRVAGIAQAAGVQKSSSQ